MWIPPAPHDRVSPGGAFAVPLAADDWHVLLSTRANVLIVAPQVVSDALMTALLPHLQGPVYWWAAGTPLAPGRETQTVVLDDVGRLDAFQQSAALGLIAGRQHRFISLSRRPLYDLVLEHKFADDLYYLLNTVYLPL
jgi:hypothetical protein